MDTKRNQISILALILALVGVPEPKALQTGPFLMNPEEEGPARRRDGCWLDYLGWSTGERNRLG